MIALNQHIIGNERRSLNGPQKQNKIVETCFSNDTTTSVTYGFDEQLQASKTSLPTNSHLSKMNFV